MTQPQKGAVVEQMRAVGAAVRNAMEHEYGPSITVPFASVLGICPECGGIAQVQFNSKQWQSFCLRVGCGWQNEGPRGEARIPGEVA